MTEQGNREVKYANKNELTDEIIRKYHPEWTDAAEEDEGGSSSGGQSQAQAHEQISDNKAETNADNPPQANEAPKINNVKVEPPIRKEGERNRQT